MRASPLGPCRPATPGSRSDSRRTLGLATPLAALVALVVLTTLATPAALAQTTLSTSFVLSQSSVNSGGDRAVSSSFLLDGSVAQTATVGNTSSTSFQLQAGFWTSLSVESILRVAGSGSGNGSVTGPGITCALDAGAASGDCTERFVDGTTLGLIASPDPTHRFDGWTNCNSTSTTTLPGDTCQLTLNDSRTVTAAFTALGTYGDRVWRDVDADGVQDPDEPGLDGVTVILDEGTPGERTTVTAGGGLYSFPDVDPGTHQLSVDPSTLPAGVVPSYDLDGIATPHTTEASLEDGQNRTDVDFGYQPLVDLVLTKTDSEDPLPGGETLIYTLTVQNLGPGVATEVMVTDNLPTGTTLVGTSGCAEDPNGVPICSLGDLAIGASRSFTIEVSIDPAPPGSITNTAWVSAVESDIDPSNNTASETTALDDDPPEILLVGVEPATEDGVLDACETVHGFAVEAFVVQFDEPLRDDAGNTAAGDVTNPSSWSLVTAGPDLEVDTTQCGPPVGDDEVVPVASVAYDPGSTTALVMPDGAPLAPGLYRIIACGTGSNALTDLGGTPLDGDGDGVAGGDDEVAFRADPENLLGSGHFDCDLRGWTATSDSGSPADEIQWVSDDASGSPDSGAVRFDPTAGGSLLTLRQCTDLAASTVTDLDLVLSTRVRMDTDGVGVGTTLACTFYSGADCSGAPSSPAGSTSLLGDTGGQWVTIIQAVRAPAGTRSGSCRIELRDTFDAGFTADLDQVRLLDGGEVIFADGFESGDTSAWTRTVDP